MGALQDLMRPATSIMNPYIDRWRGKGGKVIGYFCTYIPVEVIHAAGIMPYRMRATGSTTSEMGDLYTSHLTCTFCRHTMDQAMKGEYGFLDGIVALFSCDHIRRMFDAWRYGKIDQPISPFYLRCLSVPFKVDELAVGWMKGEIERFKQSLESHFNVTITDDALRASIRTYNEKRRLLMSLYDLRKKEAPPVTGTEALAILIASTAVPPEEFNQLLKRALDELGQREGISGYRARLLLAGGELDNPDYIKLIEDLGGLVVSDFLCYGTRDFWDLVDEDKEPVAALAERYIERISCPRMVNYPARDEFVKSLVRDFNADGIIVQRLMYCDNWGCEGARTQWEAKKNGVPCMVLEREYVMGAVGQMRTRVQAFLETVGR